MPDPDPTGSESATLSVMFRCCASFSAGEGRGGLANVLGGGGVGGRGEATPVRKLLFELFLRNQEEILQSLKTTVFYTKNVVISGQGVCVRVL